MPWNFVILLCFVCASPYFQGTYSSPVCSSPQPIELQKRATIRCSFEKGFRSVFWYDTTDITVQDPILSLRNGVPSGSGYWSGEFNVTSDGSLIIQNVSLAHNHYFSVTIVYQPTDKLVPYNILAVVVVKPKIPFPVISACGNERVCFYQSSDVISIECQIEDTRPAIPLEWVMKTSSGDVNASYELTVKNDNVSSISRATTKDMKFTSFTLLLLSCKARDPYSVLQKLDSFVLVENTDWNNFPIKESEKYIESTSSLELTCTGDLGGYYVWKSKKINRPHLETLSFGFSLGENFTKVLREGYEYSPTGSLYVRNVRLEDEQSYFCLYGDGSSDKIISYNVFVYILPLPKVLQVSGCINYSSCSFLVNRDGNLTCIVSGVRPKIELAWRTYNQHLSSMITFNDHQRTAESNGQTYDISLTSTYHVEIPTLNNLTVECAIIGKHEELFSLSTKVTLYFRSDESRPHERDNDAIGMELWKIVIIIIVAVIFISVGVFAMIFYEVFHRRGTTYSKTTDEEISNEAVPLKKRPTTHEEDLKNVFIDELKQKYKAQYISIRPVPIMDNRFESVRNLFVEGTIEKVSLKNKSMETESDSSIRLDSYDDLFHDKSNASNRYILDGDPGTGKSFLTLKMASDWVKSIQTSYLGKVEILILLRLRQLKMGVTLYKSIKQFVLPRESKLSEENIKAILDSCGNVVMLLDGFDEYQDNDRDATSDLVTLIKGDMYSNFKVLVTTRTSTLPKMIHPRTIRLRLIGFDDEALEEYIRKAVMGDNVNGYLGNPEEAVETIKRQLSENPILDDLCRIPLFFVIFVHVTHDKDISKQLSSVTSFFRCAISCFHEHMKMKLHPSEAMQYEILENNHQELDRVAFEALSGNNHHIVWYRKDLIQYLGKDLYEQCTNVGILIEESVLDPKSFKTEVEVRFYHQLFCEWYAAHYLAEITDNSAILSLDNALGKLNPSKVLYIFRFACGQNSKAAVKLIQYLKRKHTGEGYVIPCVVEEEENSEDIKDIIRDICSKNITIDVKEHRLIQTYKVQFLKRASADKIQISNLCLRDCTSYTDHQEETIVLNSGLTLSKELNIKDLCCYENGRHYSDARQWVQGVLKYAAASTTLETIRLERCLLPVYIDERDLRFELLSKKRKVLWNPEGRHICFHLNLQSGKWEDTADYKELSTEEYNRLEETIPVFRRHANF